MQPDWPLPEGIRCVLAPNPSPMTGPGTNTYILGEGDVTVIDPGPADQSHLHAILQALRPNEKVRQILVTHAHLDHSPLAKALARVTDAPVLAYGSWDAGQSGLMRQLSAQGIGGGEGVDWDFAPDRALGDGEVIDVAGDPLQAIWTPGHFCNHLSFQWGRIIFTGDLVLGWTSSLVSPPHGDMGAYMGSLKRLGQIGSGLMLAGHGAPITDPAARLEELVVHRRAREAAIEELLKDDGLRPADLVRQIYRDTPPALIPAAERNVLAHLIDLVEKGRARCDGTPSPHALFRRP